MHCLWSPTENELVWQIVSVPPDWCYSPFFPSHNHTTCPLKVHLAVRLTYSQWRVSESRRAPLLGLALGKTKALIKEKKNRTFQWTLLEFPALHDLGGCEWEKPWKPHAKDSILDPLMIWWIGAALNLEPLPGQLPEHNMIYLLCVLYCVMLCFQQVRIKV